MAKPFGLYIHVPFCHAKCAYCDFYSRPSAGMEEMMQKYVHEAVREIHQRTGDSSPRTVYLGGGTPSSLPESLLDVLLQSINFSETEETTIEVNPEDVNHTFGEWLNRSPINRVSMGVQSFDDRLLQTIGRRHTARQAAEAVQTLRRNGVRNLSLDLIYGLPGDTFEGWENSLHGLIDLNPEHISAYALSYEHGTRLHAALQQGKVAPTDNEVLVRMYHALCAVTAANGFHHYEISNFSHAGYHSRHNSSYWDSTPYIGIGPGAHSLDSNGDRSFHHHNLIKYISEGFSATLNPDPEDRNARFNDLIFTGLRTAQGLPLDRLSAFPRSWVKNLLLEAEVCLRAGHLVFENERLCIPEEHWLISDTIISGLMRV